MQQIAAQILPQGYRVDTDYAGPTRQYVQESSALIVTFSLPSSSSSWTLAALFESFRDPLTILVSVPMSICGALIFIALGVGGASLNIYTEVGLVTLIGLISKHGILMVRFANDLQIEGRSKREAIEEAAAIRLSVAGLPAEPDTTPAVVTDSADSAGGLRRLLVAGTQDGDRHGTTDDRPWRWHAERSSRGV